MTKPNIRTTIYSLVISLAATAGSALAAWLIKRALDALGRNKK